MPVYRGSTVIHSGGGGGGGGGSVLLGNFARDLNTAANANDAIFYRFRTSADVAIDRIGVYIGASAGNIDLGIYSDDGTGQNPVNRLVSSGSTASPGTGGQQLTVTETTIPAGLFWLALAFSSASFTFGYVIGRNFDPVLAAERITLRSASTFPLPSSVTPPAATVTVAPTIWVNHS